VPRPKSVKVRLSIFRGKEAEHNLAICRVLSETSPLAIWDIHKSVGRLRGFKGIKYAVVNTRIKALEEKGYLKSVGSRETKQGGKAILYTLSAKMKLATKLYSENVDDIFDRLTEESASAIFGLISHANGTN